VPRGTSYLTFGHVREANPTEPAIVELATVVMGEIPMPAHVKRKNEEKEAKASLALVFFLVDVDARPQKFESTSLLSPPSASNSDQCGTGESTDR